MKRERIAVLVGFGLIFATAVLLVRLTEAQDCRVVRIYGPEAFRTREVLIEPDTILVPKGSCVIWYNWVRAEEVKVVFEDGKKCDDVTDAPTGFKLDPENCYVTDWIPQGGTSSLRFNQEGTYAYSVQVAGGAKVTGKIMVE